MQDSGAGLTGIGEVTLKALEAHLNTLGLRVYHEPQTESVEFRSGNFQVKPSLGSVIIPVGWKGRFFLLVRAWVLGGDATFLWFNPRMKPLGFLDGSDAGTTECRRLKIFLTVKEAQTGHDMFRIDELPANYPWSEDQKPCLEANEVQVFDAEAAEHFTVEVEEDKEGSEMHYNEEGPPANTSQRFKLNANENDRPPPMVADTEGSDDEDEPPALQGDQSSDGEGPAQRAAALAEYEGERPEDETLTMSRRKRQRAREQRNLAAEIQQELRQIEERMNNGTVRNLQDMQNAMLHNEVLQTDFFTDDAVATEPKTVR